MAVASTVPAVSPDLERGRGVREGDLSKGGLLIIGPMGPRPEPRCQQQSPGGCGARAQVPARVLPHGEKKIEKVIARTQLGAARFDRPLKSGEVRPGHSGPGTPAPAERPIPMDRSPPIARAQPTCVSSSRAAAAQDGPLAAQDTPRLAQDTPRLAQDAKPALQDIRPPLQDTGGPLQDSAPPVQDTKAPVQDIRTPASREIHPLRADPPVCHPARGPPAERALLVAQLRGGI